MIKIMKIIKSDLRYKYKWGYIVFLKYIFNSSYHMKWKAKTGQLCVTKYQED